MVQLNNSTDTSTAWKRLVFHIVVKLTIAVYVFQMRMLISLSIDEILLLMYMYWSINFRGLSFDVEMVLSCLKHMKYDLSKLR